jgi:hypothetical protein
MRALCLLLALSACSSPSDGTADAGSADDGGGPSYGDPQIVHVECQRDGLTYQVGTTDPSVLADVSIYVPNTDGGGHTQTVDFDGGFIILRECRTMVQPCCWNGTQVTIVVP